MFQWGLHRSSGLRHAQVGEAPQGGDTPWILSRYVDLDVDRDIDANREIDIDIVIDNVDIDRNLNVDMNIDIDTNKVSKGGFFTGPFGSKRPPKAT